MTRNFLLCGAILFAGATAQQHVPISESPAQQFLTSPRSWFHMGQLDFIASAIGDADRDGLSDILLSGYRGLIWYRNLGTGEFIKNSLFFPWTVGEGFITGIAIADFDGDGYDDVVGARALRVPPAAPLFLRNDRRGGYIYPTIDHFRGAQFEAWNVASADFDGDGDADVLFAGPGQDRLFLNDGTGMFQDVTATHMPNERDAGYHVLAFDADGDGDQDAVVANGNRVASEPVRIYTNDGSARFVHGWSSVPAYSACVAVADIDGDGDLDLYQGVIQNQDRLYVNDGNGNWVFRKSSGRNAQ